MVKYREVKDRWRALTILGVPIVAAALLLALRVVWEQTVWSWAGGPQMVGFSLMHSGLGILLLLALYAGVLWAAVALIHSAVKRSFGGKLMAALLLAYGAAWAVLAIPYGFWQRTFIDRFSPERSVEFLTYAAATGDLATVRAFLEHGVDIDAQGDSGTALHGAAVAGEIAVVEFLLANGADVNALNAYGDTPIANAQAGENAAAVEALLRAHGGTLIRGSEEQRSRAISEQVRRSIEESERRSGE